MKSIAISSGHGKYVRGAAGIIDEVDEARRVVNRVVDLLGNDGVVATKFHDDVSKNQNDNLNTIVDFHNGCIRDLDVSLHFNAYEQVSHPMGVEVLYVTQQALAAAMSAAIAKAGAFTDRGAKKRTDLFFLNNTEQPAILIEVCFVDSEADCDLYARHFDEICEAIAAAIGGEGEDEASERPPFSGQVFTGTVSHFGGPGDTGVDADEGLAFISDIDQAPHLFLPGQPPGTTGLARRLNPYVHYFAARFDYDIIPKAEMLDHVALVRAIKTGVELTAIPADWGPHEDTGRVADLSPSLMTDLGIETDDTVEILFPYKTEQA